MAEKRLGTGAGLCLLIYLWIVVGGLVDYVLNIRTKLAFVVYLGLLAGIFYLLRAVFPRTFSEGAAKDYPRATPGRALLFVLSMIVFGCAFYMLFSAPLKEAAQVAGTVALFFFHVCWVNFLEIHWSSQDKEPQSLSRSRA